MDNTRNPYSFNRQKLPLYSTPTPSRHVYTYDKTEDVDDYDDHLHHHQIDEFDIQQRKKRKYYEFTESGMKWSEHEKFVLLEIWGDIFMQLGRNSLRNEDWANVAERVTDALKIEISETQCRRVMNDLKRRYKKEKGKVEKFGGFSKWVFFKKMDMLMLREEECGGGLACGVDSGEFVFMDTAVYLERSNGFDEMRDSPCESEMEEEDEEEGVGEDEGEEGEMSVLADSVERFGEIYEKIEISKREQMRELERMRAEFCRELEAQKKQILERTHAEIAKIREGDGEDDSDYDDDDDDDDEEEEEEEEEEENENISD